MHHEFDEGCWDDHWQQSHDDPDARDELPPNPYLVREVGGLVPGTALEAGCGEGAEAIWLGRAGWEVVAADIAEEPLTRAAGRAAAQGLGDDEIRWIQADLGSWGPAVTFDLVTTHYLRRCRSSRSTTDSPPGSLPRNRQDLWIGVSGDLLVTSGLVA